MKPSVVVIGGGFAGLRAAVELAEGGLKVTVLEARNGLGGRARSFIDPSSREPVDNGQHLFLGAYSETIQFLRRLGMEEKLVFQKRLHVPFVERGGKLHRLSCPALPAPFHLLAGLLRFSSLSWGEKCSLLRMLAGVARGGASDESLDLMTVSAWLDLWRQSPRSRQVFWNPLVIATLNEEPGIASALGLQRVLKTLAKGGASQSRLGMPQVGLSELYARAASERITARGGEVRLNCPVARLLIGNSRLFGVRTADGNLLSPDFVVSTLPPPALRRILPPEETGKGGLFAALGHWKSSPIVSINLWLDRSLTQEPFAAMIGTRIQWLFNKSGYLSLVISAARDFIDRPNDELAAAALEDLQACFPKGAQAKLLRVQVVREREATVSLAPGTDRRRLGTETPLSNFFLAGDWTATGLPATVESAVASGGKAARAVLKAGLAFGASDEYNRPIVSHEA
ncbi:MAG: FAD-dependent oxidoreductase [Candidatus Omnitrophica bacterium]|nr:FAD-dependent oxidoreductase [Candidatus Omnitrophota bacterium]